MNSYSVLAKYYDKLMGDFDYDSYVAFVKNNVSGEGVDLCCGTGKIAIALASDCTMTGVDLSQDMLSVAMTNSKKMGKKVLWVNESVDEFQPMHKVDFVTCVCDGFNYLDDAQLQNTLSNITSYVKTGGKLIFDISSAYKLTEILGDNVFCEDYEDVTYIWNNALSDDESSVEMQLSFFEPIGGDTYRRVDEEHIQYVHHADQINAMLKGEWDFEVLDATTMQAPINKTVRLVWIATRK